MQKAKNFSILRPLYSKGSRRVSDEVFKPIFCEIFGLAEDCVTAAKLVGLGKGKILENLQKRVSTAPIARRQFEIFDEIGVEAWKQGLFT